MSSRVDQGEPTEPDADRGSAAEAGPERAPAIPAGSVSPPAPRARVRRRVRTEAPAGSDPSPAREPERHDAGENDERLRADKPPHWG